MSSMTSTCIDCANSRQRTGESAGGAQGHRLPDSLRATTDILELVAHADLLLLCVPTPYVAGTMERIRDHLRPEQARAALTPLPPALQRQRTYAATAAHLRQTEGRERRRRRGAGAGVVHKGHPERHAGDC